MYQYPLGYKHHKQGFIGKKRKIALLGSTGSIGRQALEVISIQEAYLEVSILFAQHSYQLLIEQAIAFNPAVVVIGNESYYDIVKTTLEHIPAIKVLAGSSGLLEAIHVVEFDIALNAISGYAALAPLLCCIEKKVTIALANKEALVVAGHIIMNKLIEYKTDLYPIDSEISAIFQCLQGEVSPIERVVLTASGGPFFGKKPNFLLNVKKEHALQHPTWKMGDKITIDSSTLMNKGFEMFEAKWLFNLDPEQIEVQVHQQSIIHSFVEFIDGSMKAQMGIANMRIPIQYALTYPYRLPTSYTRYQFHSPRELTFDIPDIKTFKCLKVAIDCLKKGGNTPCVLNASNEVAVKAFLQGKLHFLGIADVIEDMLIKIPFIEHPTMQNIIEIDQYVREFLSAKLKL